MKSKQFIIIVIAVVCVLVGVLVLVWTRANKVQIISFEQCAAKYPIFESYPEQCNTPDGKHFVRDIGNGVGDLIHVTAPQPNTIISSPFTIIGEARGSWYFEASFPVRLEDANGAILLETPAQAQGDWMTENFVPFKAILNFKQFTTPTGVLVLQNDNPSGDPKREKALRVPVRFATKPTQEFGKPVTLMINDKIIFSSDFAITLSKIDDSRCKPGVQCIWQGELAPTLLINGLEAIRLGTVNNKSITARGYLFNLKTATEKSATIIVTKQ